MQKFSVTKRRKQRQMQQSSTVKPNPRGLDKFLTKTIKPSTTTNVMVISTPPHTGGNSIDMYENNRKVSMKAPLSHRTNNIRSSPIADASKRREYSHFLTASKSLQNHPDIISWGTTSTIREDQSAEVPTQEFTLYNRPTIQKSVDELWKAKLAPSTQRVVEQRVEQNSNNNIKNSDDGENIWVLESESFSSYFSREPVIKSLNKRKVDRQLKINDSNSFTLLPSQRRAQHEIEVKQQRYRTEMKQALGKRNRLLTQMKNTHRNGVLNSDLLSHGFESDVYKNDFEQAKSMYDRRQDTLQRRKEGT
jgi:hypothetical protein